MTTTTKQIAPYVVNVGEIVRVLDAGNYVEKTVVETKFRNGMTTLVFSDGSKLTQNGYSTVTVKS